MTDYTIMRLGDTPHCAHAFAEIPAVPGVWKAHRVCRRCNQAEREFIPSARSLEDRQPNSTRQDVGSNPTERAIQMATRLDDVHITSPDRKEIAATLRALVDALDDAEGKIQELQFEACEDEDRLQEALVRVYQLEHPEASL